MDRDTHLIWESLITEFAEPFHRTSQIIQDAFTAAHEQMKNAPTVPTPSGRGCTPGSLCDNLARNVRLRAPADPQLAEEIRRLEPEGPSSKMLEWSASVFLSDIEAGPMHGAPGGIEAGSGTVHQKVQPDPATGGDPSI
jgi:hypothetical protein